MFEKQQSVIIHSLHKKKQSKNRDIFMWRVFYVVCRAIGNDSPCAASCDPYTTVEQVFFNGCDTLVSGIRPIICSDRRYRFIYIGSPMAITTNSKPTILS